MKVIFNSKEVSVSDSLSLSDLLKNYGYDIERIGVELNGNFVDKKKYGEIYLKENDKIIVFSFVGGG